MPCPLRAGGQAFSVKEKLKEGRKMMIE